MVFRNKKIIIALLLTLFLSLGLLNFVSAQTSPDMGLNYGAEIGLGTRDIRSTVASIIRAALGLLGIVAVVLILYAGFVWMTAGGNEENIVKAKKIMINAAIGLAIILSAYAIVSFVMNKLVEATTGNVYNPSDQVPGDEYTPPGYRNSFYISKLPAGGDVCVMNYKPVVQFSRSVDLATLNDHLLVEKSGARVAGAWEYKNGETNAVFTPSGACPSPDTGNDCLLANTDYALVFTGAKSDIKSKDNPAKPLVGCWSDVNKNITEANCVNINFKTGDGVDRLPPVLSITYPNSGSSLEKGQIIPVAVGYTDDNGVQNISLSVDDRYVESRALSGCNKAGSVILNWPTSQVSTGSHLLKALGLDFAGLTDEKSVSVNLRPPHCFDTETNEGETGLNCCASSAGCGCGLCSGDKCTADEQCQSGFCYIPSGQTEGTCFDRAQITNVSPLSGAPGTYVSISGYYFGNIPGEVYFSRGPNQWIQAQLLNCGAGVRNWMPYQILTEAPAGAVNGPIRIITNIPAGAPAEQVPFYKDATDDNYGPPVADFSVTNEVRPGLCGVWPLSGALPGNTAELRGKRFGAMDQATDQVYFGATKAVVRQSDWLDESVLTAVPGLAAGYVGVKISNNGVESNSVRFKILSGPEANLPVITGVAPVNGSPGEYITLTGKNFGNNLGRIFFKLGNNTVNGSFDFPSDCSNNIWSDTRIVVKFPPGGTPAYGKYTIQAASAEGRESAADSNIAFTLSAGNPRPGLCKADPVSGPENSAVRLTGEYFGLNINSIDGYFWKAGASENSVSGRLRANKDNLSKTADGRGDVLAVTVPAGAITGPVVVYRDAKISNPLTFSLFNCVTNNNQCSDSALHCCANGVCTSGLCAGETRSTGYVWRFCTKEIPQVPHVVENCPVTPDGALVRGADYSLALPTPSPDINLWGSDSGRVCRTALVEVEFSKPLEHDVNGNVPAGSVLVRKCGGKEGLNNCQNPESVSLRASSLELKEASQSADRTTEYLEIFPSDNAWQDNTWYQVVLMNTLRADDPDRMALAADKPCNVQGSAYCFMFKTNAEPCKMKAVILTPYSYWTAVLEDIIKVRPYNAPRDGNYRNLYYYGHGLSTQRCILMDVSAYDWRWDSSRAEYSNIIGPVLNKTNASANKNTVGVGLRNPDDALYIRAEATIGQAGQNGFQQFTGQSPLKIDLSNPQVEDFWPQCLEACLEAEIGLRFNVSMSNRNLNITDLDLGPARLFKCLAGDENCLSKIPVPIKSITTRSDNSEIIILPDEALAPSTIYGVAVSVSATDMNDTHLLWSAADRNDLSLYSKPYNQEFTWRFRTKRESCRVDRVEVKPGTYSARFLTDRAVYGAAAYSSPDACSKTGQRLNSWSLRWNWTATDKDNPSASEVAEIQTFRTVGYNRNCDSRCTRAGSDIPFGSDIVYPVCGNGTVEAGEDCDSPNKSEGCGLNCLRMGNIVSNGCGNGIVETIKGEECDPTDPNTKTGCGSSCLHLGSKFATASTAITESVCGNITTGSGEDCDAGKPADPADSASAYFCDSKCLHTGTRLSSRWCFLNMVNRGGFEQADFDAMCAKAVSQCGNGVEDADEDPDCDTGVRAVSTACDNFCLLKNSPYAGSSLYNSTDPSICGDAVAGPGEDPYCETREYFTTTNPMYSGANSNNPSFDPWALVKGKGGGTASGVPPALRSVVKADTNNKEGVAEFLIRCNYQSDAECRAAFGNDFAVGADTCCHRKAVLVDRYPVSPPNDICLNTYIAATFSGQIDPVTLNGNVMLARGSNDTDCPFGSTNLTTIPLGSAMDANSPWYKKIFTRVADFINKIFRSEAAAGVVGKWCAGADPISVDMVYNKTTETSEIRLKLSRLLLGNKDYAVVLKDGVKDKIGVSIGKDSSGNDIHWRFVTGNQMCEVNSVSITPAERYFSRANESDSFTAKAQSVIGRRTQMLQRIPNVYDWEFQWRPTDSPIVTLTNSQTAADAANTVTAQNRNGELDVTASANITVNVASAQRGIAATGQSHVTVFLCENPWPPKDLYLNEQGPYLIFPFEDKAGNNDGYGTDNKFNNTSLPEARSGKYFNWSAYYCADAGGTGVVDDLPYFKIAVQDTAAPVPFNAFLKRFIFTDANIANPDAVGVQIFANPDNLSVRDWYTAQGFTGEKQSATIDGYDAITDGNNIYVEALNVTDPLTTCKVCDNARKIYGNIYQFSINADARPATRQVFEQLMKNLKFNVNLENSTHYCGATSDSPGLSYKCENDNDCPEGQVCSAEKDKLQRNYQRLRALDAIETALNKYADDTNGKFPDLKEGTYLTGQTISTWPSWSNLGSALGRGLPVDPINKLAPAGSCKNNPNIFCVDDDTCDYQDDGDEENNSDTCLFHDPATGWSDADRRFSFACSPKSYAFRYKFPESESIQNYLFRARLERPFDVANNVVLGGSAGMEGSWDNMVKDFIGSRFTIDDGRGICFPGETITTMAAGRCGDGAVNLNQDEICDPPKTERFGECLNGEVKVDVCGNDCKSWTPSSTLWTHPRNGYVSCAFLSVCGNGIREAGEDCDAGGANGLAGSGCDANCATVANTCGNTTVEPAEFCDWSQPAGDGLLPGAPMDEQPYSVVNNTLRLKYFSNQNGSCNFDCQSYGPYCGDGQVSSEFRESCEATEDCSINGVPGKRVCTKTCQMHTPAVGWWRFENAANMTKDSSAFGHAAICTGDCPTTMPEGKVGNAAQLSSAGANLLNHITVANSADFNLNTLSIEAWVKIPDRLFSSQMLTQDVLVKARFIAADGNRVSMGGTDYAVQLLSNNGSKIDKIRFVSVDNNVGLLGTVTANVSAPYSPGEWHHIAVTVGQNYADIMNNIKFYSDGIKLNNITDSTNMNGRSGANADQPYSIKIGVGWPSGALDEVALYSRVLTAAEIQDHFQNTKGWFCDTFAGSGSPVEEEIIPECGDGILNPESGEVCDTGLDKNGAACVPGYDLGCTYCSADCKNVITVNPTAFCGNGVIDTTSAGEPEKCDFDTAGTDFAQGDIWSGLPLDSGSLAVKDNTRNGYKVTSCTADTVNDLNTYKMGDKECTNSCNYIDQNCVVCGLDMENEGGKAVGVTGSVINVVKTDLEPLGPAGSLDLYFVTAPSVNKLAGEYNGVGQNYTLKNPNDSTKNAKIGSDPLCSASTYKMKVNNDDNHLQVFPVSTAPYAGQYNLVLSPVVPKTGCTGRCITESLPHPDDVRIVLKWQGEPDALLGGFFDPNCADGMAFEAANFGGEATPSQYYNLDPINAKQGAWWHGPRTAGQTNAESFSMRTGRNPAGPTSYQCSGAGEVKGYMNNQVFAFYVRSLAPISQFLNTARLKVEVYFPDDDDNTDHFDAPDRTFEFKATGETDDVVRSANPGATYWHAFNILRADAESTITNRVVSVVNESTMDRLINGQIVSNSSQFTYIDRGVCTPQCAGKTCGDDGCGGTCGICSADKSCVTDSQSADFGRCVCPSGSTDCSGVCKDLSEQSCEGDGNLCTVGGTYADDCGLDCAGETQKICADSDTCTSDSCNATNGVCQHTLQSNCTHCPPVANCNDNNPCTADTCAGDICQHTTSPNGSSCNNSTVCDGLETCQNGTCVNTPAPPCVPDDSCHTAVCNATTGCVQSVMNGCTPCDGAFDLISCDDENACDGLEICNPATLRCEEGTAPTPTCASPSSRTCGTAIVSSPPGCRVCSSGTDCTSAGPNKVCNGSTCVCASGYVECPAGSGNCSPARTGLCDDGNACTSGETWQDVCGTSCSGGDPVAGGSCTAVDQANTVCGTPVPAPACGTCSLIGTKCSTGSCVSGQCCANECDPATYLPTCNAGHTAFTSCVANGDADPCYELVTNNCNAPNVCYLGACVGGCSPNPQQICDPSQLGQGKCSGGGFYRCGDVGRACYEWRTISGSCLDSEICTVDGCDPAIGCTHTPAAASTLCRAVAGDCDAPETCGGGTTCPADSFSSSAVTCRGSTGVCDPMEKCTGDSAACPANLFKADNTSCSRGVLGTGTCGNGICWDCEAPTIMPPSVLKWCELTGGVKANCKAGGPIIQNCCAINTGSQSVADTAKDANGNCPGVWIELPGCDSMYQKILSGGNCVANPTCAQISNALSAALSNKGWVIGGKGLTRCLTTGYWHTGVWWPTTITGWPGMPNPYPTGMYYHYYYSGPAPTS